MGSKFPRRNRLQLEWEYQYQGNQGPEMKPQEVLNLCLHVAVRIFHVLARQYCKYPCPKHLVYNSSREAIVKALKEEQKGIRRHHHATGPELGSKTHI